MDQDQRLSIDIHLGLGELKAGDILFVQDPNKSLLQEDDSPEVYIAMPYVLNQLLILNLILLILHA